MEPSTPPTSPTSPSPAQATELAAACVDYVQRALGVALDFSPDTLSLLDHYVGQASREVRAKPESLQLVARVVAAYLGEVIRGQFDCWWHEEGDDLADWSIRFRQVYLSLSPFALAMAALGVDLGDGEAEVGFVIDPEDLDDVGAYLASLPPVPEEEFSLPSTRLDTLHIIVDQLKGRAIARNLGDVIFEEPDYE